MTPDFIAEQIRTYLASIFKGDGGPVVVMDNKTRIVVLVPGGQHILVEVFPATVGVSYGR